jgi:hypothetical protein
MATPTNITTLFARQVIQEVQSGCSGLVPGTVREVKTLCDPQYWSGLSPAEQKLAGKVVVEAVRQGLLPLARQGLSKSFHRLYLRT